MTQKKKKHIIKTEKKRGYTDSLPLCALRAAGIGAVAFLFGIFILAVWYWKKQPSETLLMVFSFLCSAAAFFLCGFAACRKSGFAPAKAGLLSAAFLLLPVLGVVLLVCRSEVSLWILLHLGFALLFPIAGGLLGKRL